MDWLDLLRERDQSMVLVNMIMNVRFPYVVGKFVNSWPTSSFPRRAELHGDR
jgi:hypothetical protein